jgi:iron-sulfur cluster repair protein YtfE (RIC family)
MSVTDLLRSEHTVLRSHLDRLDTVAATLTHHGDDIAALITGAVAGLGVVDWKTPGSGSTAWRLAEVVGCVEFLQHHLIPHARAEEAVLYPAVEEALGAPGLTATMAADHRDIMRRIDALAATAVRDREPSRDQVESLRRQLYGLTAILDLHFAREEELLLPLLDAHLDENQARAVVAAWPTASARTASDSARRTPLMRGLLRSARGGLTRFGRRW